MPTRNPVDRATGEPMRCFLCQSLYHVITSCPRYLNRNVSEQRMRKRYLNILVILNCILVVLNLFLIFNRP